MTPAEFRALAQNTGLGNSARIYRASLDGVNETFLTLHTKAGRFECPAYSQLSFISGDEPGGTSIRLIFSKISVLITGRQLLPVFESIRSRRAAHLYEFDGARCDPPEPERPVITEIEFGIEQAKRAPSPSGSAA